MEAEQAVHSISPSIMVPYFRHLVPPATSVYLSVAFILSLKYYTKKTIENDIAFILRDNHTTPDILVIKTQQFWEIKNMKGISNHAVEENLRRANHQADNIIISLLRSPAKDPARIKARIKYILNTSRVRFKNVLLITKSGKIIDVKAHP